MDRRLLLIAPYAIWLLLLVLAPFSLIISTSLSMRDAALLVKLAVQPDAYLTLLDPLYLEVLLRTVLFAGLHTTITITLAYPVAFFLSRLERKEAGIYITLLLVPFWTNFLIRLLAFMDVLRLQPFGIQWTFTFKGMVAAMVYNMLPFAILPLYAALEKVDDTVLEAAQDLGASKYRIFREVLWPLTRPAVLATALLVFIPALGEYLTPELVGGGQSFFLGTFLQQQFLISRNWPVGAAAITILILLSVVLVGVGGKALEEHS